LPPGFDFDGAVAACGAHEFFYAPTGLVLDIVADGHCCDDDAQVRLDRFAQVMVDRLCRGWGYADDAGVGAGQRCAAGPDVGIVVG
jgi:hypothetical protein